MILYYMILSHLLYDFHWQGQFVGTYKSKNLFVLFIHCLTYAMFVGLPYVLLYNNYYPLIILLVSHSVIDDCKSRLIKLFGEKFWMLYVDQAFHLAFIVAIYIAY